MLYQLSYAGVLQYQEGRQGLEPFPVAPVCATVLPVTPPLHTTYRLIIFQLLRVGAKRRLVLFARHH